MHFAYVDESVGPTTFTLGCVMVEAARWPDVFDDLIDYRRFLRDRFRVPVRAEIKANHLLHNHGTFRALKLSEPARFAIYRGLMRLQAKLELKTFAVVIRKDVMLTAGIKIDPRTVAWEYLLQRLERFTTKDNTDLILFHDEGDGDFVRKVLRKARRIGGAGSFFGTGALKRPARRVLDDPVARQSHQSYFVQLADLTAYAAFRHLYQPPPRRAQIVPQAMWNELGAARFGKVNQVKGGPPGIVAWP
jgi:hypothetical protein